MIGMPSNEHHDVIVIGGGISGLSAAWRLHERGTDVMLLEADDAFGGCMKSEHREGMILEKGPFNVLVRDDAFHALLDACAEDIGPRTASIDAKRRYLLRHGALHQVPMGPGALMKTSLLSSRAKLRLLRGMMLSRRSPVAEPTIAEAAERRLGPEIAETFISSIVAGIFGGDSRALSLEACFPKAWQFDQQRRSPLLYEMEVLRRKRRAAREAGATNGHPRPSGLVSFDDGLQALPDWMAGRLGGNAVTGCRVESIERTPEGYLLRTIRDDGERTFTCRRLVVATSKEVASRLLAPLAPVASLTLDSIACSSLVVLNLAYRRQDVEHPMVGYGFLVPQNEPDMPVMGVLWADSAFPHHAPTDRRVIRVFMGGARDPRAAERPEAELLATATGAIRDLLGIQADPVLVDICPWPEAIPQYHVGHTMRIERLVAALEDLPGLHLAGNYLHGVSINDCVREGVALADSMVTTRATTPVAICA